MSACRPVTRRSIPAPASPRREGGVAEAQRTTLQSERGAGQHRHPVLGHQPPRQGHRVAAAAQPQQHVEGAVGVHRLAAVAQLRERRQHRFPHPARSGRAAAGSSCGRPSGLPSRPPGSPAAGRSAPCPGSWPPRRTAPPGSSGSRSASRRSRSSWRARTGRWCVPRPAAASRARSARARRR